jgi:hypothetical protein
MPPFFSVIYRRIFSGKFFLLFVVHGREGGEFILLSATSFHLIMELEGAAFDQLVELF